MLSKEELKKYEKEKVETNPFLSTADAVSKLGKSAKKQEDVDLDPTPKAQWSSKGMCSCCGSKEHNVRKCPLKDDMKEANKDKKNTRMDLKTQMGRKQRGLNQRIFLMDVKSELSNKTKDQMSKNPDCKKEYDWALTITGTTGNT